MSKKQSKSILVFDANLKLVGMFSSYYTAAKVTGISHQVITKACNGALVAVNGMYWREVNIKEYVLDCDDLGALNLLVFDHQHGQNRKIYATRSMKRNEIILESEYKHNTTKQ